MGCFASVPYKPAVKNTGSKERIYRVSQDYGPHESLAVAHIPDPIPLREPIIEKLGNNTPYKINGKTYHVNFDTRNYRETGYASWYGKKFHGELTSNGEIYNMYGMTAAHKTLPIPSYVRVTNTVNHRSVVVRINDRGPFYSDRIIDLTYTAAKKLGFVEQGTAPVVLETLADAEFNKKPSVLIAPEAAEGKRLAPLPRRSGGFDLPRNTYLQVGAYSSIQGARAKAARIRPLTSFPVSITPIDNGRLLRVLIGPIHDNFELAVLHQKIVNANFPEPNIVQRH